MCFRLALLHSTTFIFLLYRSPSSSSCSVVEALILQPSANIMVYGDPNVHNTDVAGLFCQEFAMAQNLSQIVDFPTCIPDCDDHQPYLLDLFLCSNPDSCTVASHPKEKTEWVEIGIDCYIPHRKFQSSCAAAIATIISISTIGM